MYLFFTIICLMFLAFNLNFLPGRPWHSRYVLLWKWGEYTLVRIFPQGIFVLVDHDMIYRYLNTNSHDTYIEAVRMDTQTRIDILHYQYLLDWIKEPPMVKPYPSELIDEIDILNWISQNLK